MSFMFLTTPHQHGSYRAKLFDKRWLIKRESILKRDGYCCTICGKKSNLVVHHKQYHFIKKLNLFSEPWDYHDIYLITLCKSCHDRGHRLYEIPIICLLYTSPSPRD